MSYWQDSRSKWPRLHRQRGATLPSLPRQLHHGISFLLLLLLLPHLCINKPNPKPQPSRRSITTVLLYCPTGQWSASIQAVAAHYAKPPASAAMTQRNNAIDLNTATTDSLQDNYDDAEFHRAATADDSGKCLITSCPM